MAWEPLICMTRKLLITLAGAMLRDAYLQIMIALLILIASLTLQALVQPYESRMLNTLDVLSIMVLIITQVLSILYLYLENLTGVLPLGMTSNGIEIAMTLLLFAANASVIAGLFIAWIVRIVYERLGETARKLKKARRGAALETSLELANFASRPSEFCAAGNVGELQIHRPTSGGWSSSSVFSRKNPLGPGGGASLDDVDDDAAATLCYTPSWWDTQGIEVGDEVRHPELGEGVVVEIDYDDSGLVQLEFEAHETVDGAHQELRRLDFDVRDWTTLSQREGFDITRPTGCVDAAAARLQRDLNEARLRGDEAGLQMLRLELKALTLPSAIKDHLREIRRLKWASTGGDTGGDAGHPEADGAAREGGEDEEEAGGAENTLAESMVSDHNWFYADADDEGVLHGPHSVAQLQEWVDFGHFALTDLVRNGRTGELVELALALHMAPVVAAEEGAAAADEAVDPAVVHPRGWSEHSHEGDTYYNNDHTGETTFTKPTLPAAPEGWSVHAHGDDGEYYFENDADGELQWHHPHDPNPLACAESCSQ